MACMLFRTNLQAAGYTARLKSTPAYSSRLEPMVEQSLYDRLQVFQVDSTIFKSTRLESTPAA